MCLGEKPAELPLCVPEVRCTTLAGRSLSWLLPQHHRLWDADPVLPSWGIHRTSHWSGCQRESQTGKWLLDRLPQEQLVLVLLAVGPLSRVGQRTALVVSSGCESRGTSSPAGLHTHPPSTSVWVCISSAASPAGVLPPEFIQHLWMGLNILEFICSLRVQGRLPAPVWRLRSAAVSIF